MEGYRFTDSRSRQVAYFNPFRGHMRNPGMGIICMAVSDHMVTGYSPEAWARADREKPFELTREMLREAAALGFIDNFYIRVGWNDVQKEPGKLYLSKEFEMTLEAVEEAGLSWGFRIMQASPSNPLEHLLPPFLVNRLPTHPYYNGRSYGPWPKKLPLYTDEYLKYWNEMLAMLGERFDPDTRLEYGDVSGYGLWGEGHHGCEVRPGVFEDLVLDSPERTNEVIETLIRGHRKAFPHTPAVLNLVMSEYEPVRKAIREGCWVRRDSYYKWFEAHHAEAGLQRSGDAAMIFETVMPGMDLEDQDDPAFRHSSLELPRRMCEYGANYGIVGFNPLDTLYAAHVMPQLFDDFRNSIGYRLRPSIIWKTVRPNGKASIALGMVNDGCANPPGEMIFSAKCGEYESTASVNGSAFSGRMTLVEIPLPEAAKCMVELSMSINIQGKVRPVCFAADDGSGKAPYVLNICLDH
ncbi:MAG: hypothetical protein J6A79_18175 [Clostridia bacterium]|nr:hypothetical protein [Clostridia bacterium]